MGMPRRLVTAWSVRRKPAEDAHVVEEVLSFVGTQWNPRAVVADPKSSRAAAGAISSGRRGRIQRHRRVQRVRRIVGRAQRAVSEEVRRHFCPAAVARGVGPRPEATPARPVHLPTAPPEPTEMARKVHDPAPGRAEAGDMDCEDKPHLE